MGNDAVVITRHQFLTMLHDLLKPSVYLEIGVQYGLSLDLAVHSEWAIGIDPNPLVQAKGNQTIYQMTADNYFDQGPHDLDQVDLVFIDGSHLFEDVLRDFNNVTRYCGPKSVIVFDDVLPYNQEIASRTMPPAGDWTGDAWKVVPIIVGKLALTGASMKLVNTFPTGSFVLWNLPIHDRLSSRSSDWRLVKLEADYEDLVDEWRDLETVPDYIIQRTKANEAQDVIDMIREDLCA